MEAATSATFGPVTSWCTMPMPAERQPVFERIRSLATTSPVVVLTLRGCCMAVVVETMLHRLGVAPKLVEIEAGGEIKSFLDWIAGILPEENGPQVGVPAVFVGGRYIGGVTGFLACHMRGHLVPMLKEAGALWL